MELGTYIQLSGIFPGDDLACGVPHGLHFALPRAVKAPGGVQFDGRVFFVCHPLEQQRRVALITRAHKEVAM